MLYACSGYLKEEHVKNLIANADKYFQTTQVEKKD
jgi:hypothetical protein